MKNKQNNEFSHFFFIDDIFYMIILDYKLNTTKSSQKALTLTL